MDLGALADVVCAALNAVHHANRRGPPDDRIAVALPQLHVCRGRARPGSEIVLFGAQSALDRCIALEGIQRLSRRGMVRDLDIMEAFSPPNARGTAYVRDRQADRRSPGALRRARARAERRGVARPDAVAAQPPSPALLALYFGSAVVHVRAVELEMTAEPLMIGTYGFSAMGSPAVLPILSEQSARDAA